MSYGLPKRYISKLLGSIWPSYLAGVCGVCQDLNKKPIFLHFQFFPFIYKNMIISNKNMVKTCISISFSKNYGGNLMFYPLGANFFLLYFPRSTLAPDCGKMRWRSCWFYFLILRSILLWDISLLQIVNLFNNFWDVTLWVWLIQTWRGCQAPFWRGGACNNTTDAHSNRCHGNPNLV